MAKRFTDTGKWNKPFIRTMKSPYKLLWLYILDECDHAGIWQVDLDVAQIKIGEKLNIDTAIHFFKDKIYVFDNGNKWFISDFIDFQYGILNPTNRAHNSVITILNKYNIDINKPLTSPLQGAKDKDMDKDIDKDVYKKFKHLNISIEDFNTLNLQWTKEQIDFIIGKIENYAKNNKYSSLYLTALDWLKKEYPKQIKSNKYTEAQIRQAKNYWTMDRILPEFFDKNDLHLLQ